MKRLIIDLDQSWVLAQRTAGQLPAALIAEVLQARGLTVSTSGFTKITVDIQDDSITPEQIHAVIVEKLTEKYNVSSQELDKVMRIQVGTVAEKTVEREQPVPQETGAGQTEFSASRVKLPMAETDEDKLEAVMTRIRGMLGAKDFIALCERILKVAPRLTSSNLPHILMGRSYLFSIDDGYGMTSALNAMADLLELLRVGQLDGKNGGVRGEPVEMKLEAAAPNKPDPFAAVMKDLGFAANKLVCIDIREWADKTATPEFRDFLMQLQKNDKLVYVFRVPYLERDTLSRIEGAMSDVLNIETVSFVPLTPDELLTVAKATLKRYGMDATDEAWELYQQRLAEERSDGRFYGIKTAKKVVDEMVYRKFLELPGDEDTISAQDLRGFVKADTSVSAAEKMEKLVGIDGIRDRLEEIIRQIEFSRKNPGVKAPSMHMRFVGNPGTGKTTVARIVGQMLKERGILSKGYFFEHTGGDFLGMYVGHTAPKTLALCRDAYGSVLFIDEAYTLADANYSNGDGFAKEAIDTLIAQMENHRDDLVVIMAGYPREMGRLMALNPGLAGRIPYELVFPNYCREDLFRIFLKMVEGDNFVLTPEAEEAARKYFLELPDSVLEDKDFSNARFVRNLFERTWSKTIMRAQLDGSDPMIIQKADFDTAAQDDVKSIGRKHGKSPRPGYKLGLV